MIMQLADTEPTGVGAGSGCWVVVGVSGGWGGSGGGSSKNTVIKTDGFFVFVCVFLHFSFVHVLAAETE